MGEGLTTIMRIGHAAALWYGAMSAVAIGAVVAAAALGGRRRG